ncbi:hypothetical protein [Litorimonas sp. WD9-15]|uniref:hypothetical protein n=1 Tax=Litorimonas sp. WD9-15 TaxID=3418716 RepID=UPI003D060DCE
MVFKSEATVDAEAETVQVNLSVEVPRIFAGIIMDSNPRISVSSVSKIVRNDIYCVYALNPTASGAIDGNGNAILQGDICSIYTASSSASPTTNSGAIFIFAGLSD